MSAPARLRYTILGCGSSGGVPRLGGPGDAGNWGACDPTNPKNRRRRCALLVERFGPDGATRVLIDAGPDVREQLLDAKVSKLDGVLITHDHADHTHGLDDLRLVFFNIRRKVPIWIDDRTFDIVDRRFDYLFETPEGSLYPPILERYAIKRENDAPNGPWLSVVVDGPGGPIEARPFEVVHGRIPSLGFRFDGPNGATAYLPDVSEMTPEAWAAVEGLDLWIIDTLRYTPHPSHANVETALAWIEAATPKRAILTNMHVDIDHATIDAETPDHIAPAYDGLSVEI